jgi:GTPase SAR1 family protein
MEKENPGQAPIFSSFDMLMKICVIGDSNVGKTALAQRYIEDKFDEKYYATIGVEFVNSHAKITFRNQNKFN